MSPLMIVSTRLMTYDLRRFVIGALLWMPFSIIPLAGGFVLQQLFDQISGHRAAGLAGPLWLCAAFVGVEIVRGLTMVVSWTYGVYWWDLSATLLRANVLNSVLTARGPAAGRLPDSSGESVARLRDDVAELVDLVDEGVVGIAGAALFGAAALGIMTALDPAAGLVLPLPMLAIIGLAPFMNRVVRRLHQRSQAAGAAVTAWVGELVGNVLAIKTAGAEDAVLRRLRERNRERRDAAVRVRLVVDLLDTATDATTELGIGLVLLLTAAAMRRGAFTVGDLALFTSYLGWLTNLPAAISGLIYRLPRGEVSLARLSRLMAAHEDAHDLMRDEGARPTAIDESLFARVGQGDDEPLRTLEIRGLTVRHDSGGHGVQDVDLTVARGSFTVVTGAVGAGKTTLVRALLGLLPIQAGTIEWNGRPVEDPGTFLVPGRAAYASQVPRLFSATLHENLLLGAPDEHLSRALRLAAFEDEPAEMPDGLDTRVGPRGVRLSGGQMQRVTAARALARAPELLVVDDLSSALDVETEKLLWDRIAGSGPRTLLVVSHRRAVLERADQVVVLDRGRVVGCGRARDLLRDNAELRRLWSGELTVADAADGVRGDACDPAPDRKRTGSAHG
ncbi:MAG: ABC transporter ATP-binding protein [Actinocrinis sp.]